MNKGLSLCLLLAATLLPLNANAMIKFDFGAVASDVANTIGQVPETVQKTVDTVSEQALQFKTLGAQVKVRIEVMRAMFEDIAASVNEVRDAYSDLSSTVNDVVDGVTSGINQATGIYEDAMGLVENSTILNAGEMTKELTELNDQLAERESVIGEELAAKKKAAEQNLAILQAMLAQTDDEQSKQVLQNEIAKRQEELAQCTQNLERFQADPQAYLAEDGEYAEMKERRDHLQTELTATGIAVGTTAISALSKKIKFTKEQKAAEYGKVIEENFLLPEQPENAENVRKIMVHRQKVMAQDIAHAMQVGSELKLAFDEQLETGERKQSNLTAADYKLTSGNILVEQRIADIQALHQYTTLLIADLRLKTSQSMFQRDTRLRDYEKDPAVMNLDNYVFTKDDIKSDADKKSFLDGVTK